VVVDDGEFIMHNIIVRADSCFDSLLHQEAGLAVLVFNLVFIQIEPYLYTSLLGFYEGKGDFSVGKDVHGYVDGGLGPVDIFDDFFLGIVV